MVYQGEVGDNGTHHWQGYVEFPVPRRMAWIKEVLGDTVHLEKAMGTADECEAYCTKEDTRVDEPIRYGTRGGNQGQRSDVLSLRDAVRDGKRGRDLYDDDGVAGPAIRYARGIADMSRAYSDAHERPDIRVVFHFGAPGTGKTYCAHSDGAYYFDGNQGEFWIGYKGQKECVLDEFGGHVLKPLTFQRLCDKYPLWLPIKGGEVPCEISTVHVCSNYLPDQWWGAKTKYSEQAIFRRIVEVHWHHAFKKYKRYTSDTELNPDDPKGWAMTKFMKEFREANPIFVVS